MLNISLSWATCVYPKTPAGYALVAPCCLFSCSWPTGAHTSPGLLVSCSAQEELCPLRIPSPPCWGTGVPHRLVDLHSDQTWRTTWGHLEFGRRWLPGRSAWPQRRQERGGTHPSKLPACSSHTHLCDVFLITNCPVTTLPFPGHERRQCHSPWSHSSHPFLPHLPKALCRCLSKEAQPLTPPSALPSTSPQLKDGIVAPSPLNSEFPRSKMTARITQPPR